MFQRVKTTRISEEIASQIRARVLGGELGPDDKLPSENELAAMFGASRTSVREALRSLEASGLVVIKRGARGGPHVASHGLELVGKSLSEALRVQGTPIEQITEARLLIEPALAELAAERVTGDDLAAIESTIVEMESKLDSGGNPVLGNLEFHRLVAKASHNAVLVVVLDASLMVLEDVVEKLPIDRAMVEGMLSAHKKIYEALAKGQAKKAFRLMTAHVHEAHEGLSRVCFF